MEGASKPDSDAWVEQYGDALFHFAIARVKHRETAEDLVQETFPTP
jgi:DNA-directed RNA polymerase specialized sigma24 family protein